MGLAAPLATSNFFWGHQDWSGTQANSVQGHLNNHCVAYGSDTIWQQCKVWVSIGSGNGLLPDDTKPVHESMLTYHQ